MLAWIGNLGMGASEAGEVVVVLEPGRKIDAATRTWKVTAEARRWKADAPLRTWKADADN